MSFPQLASDSGYGGLNDFFLRCMNSPDQNADGRKNDENDPSHSCRFSFKTNEGNTKRKAKICRKHFWNLQKMEKCTTAANSVIQIKGMICVCKMILFP